MNRTKFMFITALALAMLPLSGCATMKEAPVIGSLLGSNKRDPSVLARELLDIYDADKRRRAISEISNAYYGGEELYIKVYRQYINDEDPTVRSASIHALGVHGSGSDAPAIIPFLSANNAYFIRWEAASALQRLQHPSAIEPLITTLRQDDNGDVRQAAANALGQYPDRRVFEALLGTLNEQDYSVVQQSAESLATITGQDFGDDGTAWLKWSRESTSMFTDAQAYYYPQFDRPLTMMEKMKFWKPKPEALQPQSPRGAEVSSASSQISNSSTAPTAPQTSSKSVPAYTPPVEATRPTVKPSTVPFRGARAPSQPRTSSLGAKDNKPANTVPEK